MRHRPAVGLSIDRSGDFSPTGEAALSMGMLVLQGF